MRLSAPLAAAFLLLIPQQAIQAQSNHRASPVKWRLVAEALGTAGGTWLQGPRSPTVSSKVGFVFALGAERAVTDHVAVGASARVGVQPLSIRENGSSWSGGTLTESAVLATMSFRPRARASVRLSFDASGGAAALSSASRILPFEDAARVAPLAEVGVALQRGSADASRRNIALLFRYSALRFNVGSVNAFATSGWVGRVMAGVRVTR